MPASRIAFAFADLMSEIRSLLPRDAEILPSLRLDPATYDVVKSELSHHFGQKLPQHEMVNAEAVKVGGMVIFTQRGE